MRAAVVGIVFLTACSECPVGPGTALVCEGVPPYLAVEDDGVLPVIFGAQGGYHLLLAARVDGIDPGSEDLVTGWDRGDLPLVEWTISTPDEQLSAESPRPTVSVETDHGWVLGPHTVVLHYFEDPPEEFDGYDRQAELEQLPITVSVTVTDACGTVSTDERTVRLDYPDPPDEEGSL